MNFQHGSCVFISHVLDNNLGEGRRLYLAPQHHGHLSTSRMDQHWYYFFTFSASVQNTRVVSFRSTISTATVPNFAIGSYHPRNFDVHCTGLCSSEATAIRSKGMIQLLFLESLIRSDLYIECCCYLYWCRTLRHPLPRVFRL